MKEIKAPNQIPNSGFIFLAGSIEMGAAEKWQERVVRELEDTDWTILNPRRDDWDSSWEQNINNEKFVEQVEWELEAMEKADHILIYFDPSTKSPITLLELGLQIDAYGLNYPNKLNVICPEGFWRKGNVDVVCRRYNVKQFDSIDDVIIYFKEISPK